MSDQQESAQLSERGNPYMPTGPAPLVFEDFTGGLNTDASRPAVDDKQQAWCDGWMPHGKGELRTLPGIGAPLYDGGAPASVSYFDFANVGPTPICVVFRADGSLVQVNTQTRGETVMAPPGTIATPTQGHVGVSRSGAQFVIIVSDQPNGYFLWDGVALYGAGTIGPTIEVTASGSGYTSPGATITGGSGTGALINPIQIGGFITSINIANAGTGYLPGDVLTVNIFDGGAGTGATATATVMPFGISGNTAETYQTRVWVAQGSRIQFSAPGSATDFATASGGGMFISSDSFLRVAFTRLVQTNGFLYLIADSSINYISGVTTAVPSGGGAPVTTFSNQNANPECGTPYGDTVDVFSENIVFINDFGAHVSYGGRVQKISEALDGVYNSVPAFGGLIPSSAKAQIYGKKVWMFLIEVVDTYTGQLAIKFFMWNGKIWWSSQQDAGITFIQSQEINSVLTAYGTNFQFIWPLFNQPSTALKKTVQSKLWAAPGGYMFTKAASRLWGLAAYHNLASPDLTISIDNELGTAPNTVTVGPELLWINNVGGPITWPGLTWLQTAGKVLVFAPQAVGQQGALTGLTISTNCADMTLISVSLGEQIAAYRG